MKIKKNKTDIIYQNEINSYTVAQIETEDAETTIVGYLPFINVGDTLKLIGKFVKHQDYGEQFKVETFEKIMPKSLASLERYLANGTIKGVGPATASKIIKNPVSTTNITIFSSYPPSLLSCIASGRRRKNIIK